jgi:hypothetical protein
MTRFGLSRRTRTFLLWAARLALLAYIMQLGAFDHWHSHFDGVVGVEGSSAHVQHCHGAGDCSAGGGAALVADNLPATLPRAAGITYAFESASQAAPLSAFITPPSEPPQAA